MDRANRREEGSTNSVGTVDDFLDTFVKWICAALFYTLPSHQQQAPTFVVIANPSKVENI